MLLLWLLHKNLSFYFQSSWILSSLVIVQWDDSLFVVAFEFMISSCIFFRISSILLGILCLKTIKNVIKYEIIKFLVPLCRVWLISLSTDFLHAELSIKTWTWLGGYFENCRQKRQDLRPAKKNPTHHKVVSSKQPPLL